MLPPFVPPSARAAGENLPPITNFVIDRVEQSFESSFRLAGTGAEGGVATLPSIQEFVVRAGESSSDEDEFVQRTSRSPWGAYEAQHEVAGGGQEGPEAPAASTLQPDLLLDHHTYQSGTHDPIVNEIVDPADAWTASTVSVSVSVSVSSDAAPTETPTEEASEVAEATSTAAPEVWMAEERDAFDWHAAANLTVPPAEAQRAADEWSSTEWDRSDGSVQDHIATLLSQISRRVRSGELEVQGSKQMGTEAALVAALSALLAESPKS
ncbi:MAG: hypothetical protein ABI119_08985 [Gemmatimonadaceae bacterium]